MYSIGIDLGTSSVKLILTDETLRPVKTASREYPLDFTAEGKSEQAPADWMRAVREGLSELTRGLPEGSVTALGVGGQMHGLVMLDENDRVLRPAILWNDTRPAAETAYLNREIGVETLRRHTGNIAFAGFTAPKLLWVRRHEPEIFAKCRRICLPKDYVNYMLTGVFATDVSDASGMLLFDVANRRWSPEMCEICGITTDMLPAVYESAAPIGRVRAEYGLGENVTVCAGAGDNAAAAVGTDTVKEGACSISLGTSGTVFLPTDRFVLPSNSALHSFCHANGRWHLMGCILSAASCDKWLVETVFGSRDYDTAKPALTPETAGKNVFFLPYLAGERCPHNSESLRGAFFGLSHETSREDLRRAVYEGVSFAIRDCLSLVETPVKRARVCGGGSRSAVWMEILANVLDTELEVVSAEGPALGAAALAMAAAGNPQTPVNDVRAVVKPDPALAAIYGEKYERFRKYAAALM